MNIHTFHHHAALLNTVMRYREFQTDAANRTSAKTHAKWVRDAKRNIQADEAGRLKMQNDLWLRADKDLEDMDWQWELDAERERNLEQSVIPKILKQLGYPPSYVRRQRMKKFLQQRQHERLLKHRKPRGS